MSNRRLPVICPGSNPNRGAFPQRAGHMKILMSVANAFVGLIVNKSPSEQFTVRNDTRNSEGTSNIVIDVVFIFSYVT